MSFPYLFKAYERNFKPTGTCCIIPRNDVYYIAEYLGESERRNYYECGVIAEVKSEEVAVSFLGALNHIKFLAG